MTSVALLKFFMTLCVSQTTGQWPVPDLHWPVRRPWHGPLQEEPRPPFHSVESGSSLPQGNSRLLKTARVRHKNHRGVILNVSCYFYPAIQEIINTWWIFYLWRIPEQTIFIFICYKEMNLRSIILLFFSPMDWYMFHVFTENVQANSVHKSQFCFCPYLERLHIYTVRQEQWLDNQIPLG